MPNREVFDFAQRHYLALLSICIIRCTGTNAIKQRLDQAVLLSSAMGKVKLISIGHLRVHETAHLTLVDPLRGKMSGKIAEVLPRKNEQGETFHV